MIDGWLVRASLSGLAAYWLVKGYEHPEDGVVAVPYRLALPPRRLGLEEGLRLACGLGVCRRPPCLPRAAPVLRLQAVEALDPLVAFRVRRRELPQPILDLVDHLGVEAGLTGSWAVYAEREDSDVDLLVWTADVYKTLEDLAEDGLVDPHCERHQRRDAARGVRRGAWRRGLLDACYRGYPYTLRILRARERAPCACNRVPLGVWEGLAVLEPVEPHLTPARYEADAPGLGRVIVETWRTRYSELRRGVYRVRGVVVYEECTGARLVNPDIGGVLEPSRRDDS